MQETKIEIKTIKKDIDTEVVDEATINEAIFVEDRDYISSIFQICLTGKYNKTYSILTDYPVIISSNVLVDEELLFVGLFSQIGIIDLKHDKLIKEIELDGGQIFGIYKFKSGYFIHQEIVNCFLDKNFNVLWEGGCIDIFANSLVEDVVELNEDYIAVFDWYGGKHYYNEQGEFKTEYYKQYSMD